MKGPSGPWRRQKRPGRGGRGSGQGKPHISSSHLSSRGEQLNPLRQIPAVTLGLGVAGADIEMKDLTKSLPVPRNTPKAQEDNAKSIDTAQPIGEFVKRCLETTGNIELAQDGTLLLLVVQQFAVCGATDVPKLKGLSKKRKVRPQWSRKAKCFLLHLGTT